MEILSNYQIFMLLIFTLLTGNIVGNYFFKYFNKKEIVKPIVLVRMQSSYDLGFLKETREMLKNRLIDYNILLIRQNNIDRIEFEVFYEKDFNKVKYEELKQIIENYSLKQKNENICYKDSKACKYNCQGLCKESC